MAFLGDTCGLRKSKSFLAYERSPCCSSENDSESPNTSPISSPKSFRKKSKLDLAESRLKEIANLTAILQKPESYAQASGKLVAIGLEALPLSAQMELASTFQKLIGEAVSKEQLKNSF